MGYIYNSQELRDRRRELRTNSTRAEKILWNELRNSKLGFRFRRQHSIAGYILDFYCVKKKLIVEVDGESHDSLANQESDRVRDKFFRDLGCSILRFKNKDVQNRLDKVRERITKEISSP